jgi:hypothetical protein
MADSCRAARFSKRKARSESAMKEWRTARELAAARLPGLPTGRSKVLAYARRNTWRLRERPGDGLRGGARLEFHLSNLTLDQQKALIEFEATKSKLPVAVVGDGAPEAGAMPAIAEAVTGFPNVETNALTESEIDEVLANRENAERTRPGAVKIGDRDLRIVELIDSLRKSKRCTLTEAYQRAMEAENVGLSTVKACWAIAWRFRAHRHLWLHALTPPPPNRKSFIDHHPELSAFLMAVIIERKNQIGDGWLWRVAQAKFNLPATREQTIKRECRLLKEKFKVEIAIATNPDRARSLYMPARTQGRRRHRTTTNC